MGFRLVAQYYSGQIKSSLLVHLCVICFYEPASWAEDAYRHLDLFSFECVLLGFNLLCALVVPYGHSPKLSAPY